MKGRSQARNVTATKLCFAMNYLMQYMVYFCHQKDYFQREKMENIFFRLMRHLLFR